MSQMATVLSFKHHVHPEEVNPELREKMAHNIGIDHLVWSGFVAFLGVILMAGTFIVDTVDKVAPAMYWHLGTFLAVTVCAELACFIVYDRRKRFVRMMPATTAVVVQQRDLADGAVGVQRAQVRYLPNLGSHFDAEMLRTAAEAFTAWADLDGLSLEFEKALRPGDLVTILYDPLKPSHIRIVEFEH